MHFSMRKGCKVKLIVLLCFAAAIIFCVIAAVRIDKLYMLRAQSYASTSATKIINTSVQSVIEKNPDYTGFVHLFQDENSRVTAAEGNTVLMNRFKSELTVEIEKELAAQSAQNVYIPLGSIFGTSLLNNRGINIPVKLMPVSDIKTDFYDELKACGINTTKHSLYINVETELSIISYLSSSVQTVKTSVPVAETLIAGEVPVYFSNGGNIGITHNADEYEKE